ncbi:MAG: PadR family transcriptional regulator [Thermoanaerobaculia bacterium]
MTELESCVLAIVWREGPLTAYEIAKPFATSPSSYWSGSAGAIYPLVKRLEAKGLIRGELTAWNSRRKRTFTITPAGLELLHEWLSPPFESGAGAASFDPIRTRIVFLGALAPRMRRRFLEDAERVVHERLAELEALYEVERGEGKALDALGTRGAIYELRARLQWLAEARQELLGAQAVESHHAPPRIRRRRNAG